MTEQNHYNSVESPDETEVKAALELAYLALRRSALLALGLDLVEPASGAQNYQHRLDTDGDQWINFVKGTRLRSGREIPDHIIEIFTEGSTTENDIAVLINLETNAITNREGQPISEAEALQLAIEVDRLPR